MSGINTVRESYGGNVDVNEVYTIITELSNFIVAIPGPTFGDVNYSYLLLMTAKDASHSAHRKDAFTDAAFLEDWAKVEPRLTADLLTTVLAWLEERIRVSEPTVAIIYTDWLNCFGTLQQILHIEHPRRHKDKNKGKKKKK
jgi:hypothetical protein